MQVVGFIVGFFTILGMFLGLLLLLKMNSQRSAVGCIIAFFSAGVLLPTLLAILALLGTDYQWMMFKSYIAVFPFALISFLLSFWKPLIGGILLILIGLGTIIGPSIVAINTPELEQGVFLLLPLTLFIGVVLLYSRILFIKYRQ